MTGWRNWYCRVSAKKQADWDEQDLDQCIALSLSNMKKNEPLLIAALYFWSDATNFFIFGHGLMTITLIDIFKLTGLNITEPLNPYDLISKGSYALKIKECKEWSGYITMHKYVVGKIYLVRVIQWTDLESPISGRTLGRW